MACRQYQPEAITAAVEDLRREAFIYGAVSMRSDVATAIREAAEVLKADVHLSRGLGLAASFASSCPISEAPPRSALIATIS